MKRVVFIQGIHDIPIKNKKLLEFLREEGVEVKYFPVFYTIYDIEKQKELILSISQYIRNGTESVSILAHSFGGIIAYSLDDEVYSKVDSIVTVATPHSLKYLWFKGLISKLNYKEREVRLQVSIGMSYDLVVRFYHAGRKATAPDHVLSGFHESLLRNKKCMKRVVAYL
jgi:hypothetical protein